MNGILIIDKPAGITSHDVVYKVRRIMKTKRVGHTGTLDPFATGVMVVLVGQATRLAQFLDKDAKEYEAIVRFGFETDTGDQTGSPTTQVPSHTSISVDDVAATLEDFRGRIEQVPPMYSAKKVDGKKLYELARKGETIERQPVSVNISKLEIGEKPTQNDLEPGTWELGLTVACSAGTYIRTLAEDIGRKIGVGAHLSGLRRTAAGQFSVADAITLEDLAAKDDPVQTLIPMETAVLHLPKIVLNEERAAKTRNGLSTRVFETGFTDGEPISMLDEGEKLVAIGYFNAAENVVQPKVVLV